MRLYNTLTRKVEEFKPLRSLHVGIYICGPTVYDYSHIGHSRTYVNVDLLIRTLKWLGYSVKSVMNITDVGHLTSQGDTGEDKIEKKARQEKKTAREVTDFYTEDFWQMEKQLNILRPEIITPASKYIREMIELIKVLEKKGYTYPTDDGIYFDTGKFPNYGRLARLNIQGLRAGWRVEQRQKKNPTDFALWKFSPKDQQRQMEWPSPWGVGFPGWHIECSAMSLKHLGETIDIHSGGVDHIPIHHTNEICQSEAATGKQFVRHWFHANFLMVEGKKMSKSLHNYLRLEDLVKKGYSPLALRYLFLTSHYRTKMNFTEKALAAAQEAYHKLKTLVSSWPKTAVPAKEKTWSDKFTVALEADLALPQVLAVVWEMAKSNLAEGLKRSLIADWDKVLGLDLTKTEKTPEKIKALIKQRDKLRKAKQWPEADKIRKKIEAWGFQIEDTGRGLTKVKRSR